MVKAFKMEMRQQREIVVRALSEIPAFGEQRTAYQSRSGPDCATTSKPRTYIVMIKLYKVSIIIP